MPATSAGMTNVWKLAEQALADFRKGHAREFVGWVSAEGA
jgi:hypothetical protein